MILIVSGGRNYEFTETDIKFLDSIVEQYGVEKIITGECMMPHPDTGIYEISGADKYGREYARNNNLNYQGFPVKPWEWKQLGRKAGPLRNRRMAQEADAVILFNGGSGTQSMYNEAMEAGLIIFDRR